MIDLIKKYPNDMDLGKAVRHAYMDGDQAIELLKETLALHGFGGYGYENGLVERGKLYLETEDGTIRKYQNSCDSDMMQSLDNRIIEFLKGIESNKK